jgi:hypothetical protein
MEIAVSSTSFRKDLAAYVSSRLAIARIALLWLVLSACAVLMSLTHSSAAVIFSITLMAILIIQFRLWDDIVDRNVDAVIHPQRVLVNSDHIQRFAYLCGGLCVPVVIVLSYFDETHWLSYGVLLLAMAIFYATTSALPRLIRAHLVLLKYPIFIWLCASNANPTQWLRYGMAAYFALCMYEIASDVALRTGKIWRWLIVIEGLACAVLLSL